MYSVHRSLSLPSSTSLDWSRSISCTDINNSNIATLNSGCCCWLGCCQSMTCRRYQQDTERIIRILSEFAHLQLSIVWTRDSKCWRAFNKEAVHYQITLKWHVAMPPTYTLFGLNFSFYKTQDVISGLWMEPTWLGAPWLRLWMLCRSGVGHWQVS